MSMAAVFVIGLLAVCFWRQLLAAIAAGIVLLVIAGVAFFAQAVTSPRVEGLARDGSTAPVAVVVSTPRLMR